MLFRTLSDWKSHLKSEGKDFFPKEQNRDGWRHWSRRWMGLEERRGREKFLKYGNSVIGEKDLKGVSGPF